MNIVSTIGFKYLKDILLDNKMEDLSMESNEEISSRLKFIGHIQKDEKINVRYVNRQHNNWITTVSRTILYPDNRANSLKFVKDVISRSFEIIEQYIRKQNINAIHSLINDLIKSQQGLLNLKYTYSEDTKFCCDMDVMIEHVRLKLVDLKEKHPEFFDTIEREERDEKEENLLT
jgi:hypothetical protein